MTPVKKPAAPPTAAGYSMASLPAKLGFHPNERVGLVNAPPGFEALLEPVPKRVRSMRAARSVCELWIWFPRHEAELRRDIPKRIELLGARGVSGMLAQEVLVTRRKS